MAEYGEAAVRDHLLVRLGWKANPAGTGMLDEHDHLLTQKQVRQALKARFGPALSQVTTQVPKIKKSTGLPHPTKTVAQITWR